MFFPAPPGHGAPASSGVVFILFLHLIFCQTFLHRQPGPP